MLTEQEFTQIVECYLDMVYRIALNWHRSPLDAEDAAQNAMFRLWQTDTAFQSDEAFYGLDFFTSEQTKISRENYTTTSGLETEILAIDRGEARYNTYLATFSLNGVPLVVRAHSYNSLDEVRTVLL